MMYLWSSIKPVLGARNIGDPWFIGLKDADDDLMRRKVCYINKAVKEARPAKSWQKKEKAKKNNCRKNNSKTQLPCQLKYKMLRPVAHMLDWK